MSAHHTCRTSSSRVVCPSSLTPLVHESTARTRSTPGAQAKHTRSIQAQTQVPDEAPVPTSVQMHAHARRKPNARAPDTHPERPTHPRCKNACAPWTQGTPKKSRKKNQVPAPVRLYAHTPTARNLERKKLSPERQSYTHACRVNAGRRSRGKCTRACLRDEESPGSGSSLPSRRSRLCSGSGSAHTHCTPALLEHAHRQAKVQAQSPRRTQEHVPAPAFLKKNKQLCTYACTPKASKERSSAQKDKATPSSECTPHDTDPTPPPMTRARARARAQAAHYEESPGSCS
jgi:hypothetical protein